MADFTDCTDDWQEDKVLEVASADFLTEKKVKFVRKESGWCLIARLGDVEIFEGESYLCSEFSLSIAAEDRAGALYIAEGLLQHYRPPDTKSLPPWRPYQRANDSGAPVECTSCGKIIPPTGRRNASILDRVSAGETFLLHREEKSRASGSTQMNRIGNFASHGIPTNRP